MSSEEKLRKNFVIDTSVLVYHEDAIHAFGGHNVFIPITVLEELDGLKKRLDPVGNAARYVNRFLDELRLKGSLEKGVRLENDQVLFVYVKTDMSILPKSFEDINDNKILSSAKLLSSQVKNVTVISRDVSMRVKANSLGMLSEDYSREKAKIERRSAYTGVSVLHFDQDELDEFYKEGYIDAEDLDLLPNEFIVLKGGQKSALGVVKNNKIAQLTYTKKKGFGVEGIQPRNKEQTFAMEMLMDPDIHMVTITGMAGSGKTLLTCAVAISKLFTKEYDKIILSRPIKSMSADIGFLPGPQPLDAKILTPEGWTTMGEIKVGDYVISRDGSKAKVLNVFPKGKKDVYKLTTTSGISAESCGDHIWATKDFEEKKRGKKYSLKTLNQIKESLKVVKNKKEKLNHYLPRNEAVNFSKKEVSIPPYTLGMILGDGSISSSISIINRDLEAIEKVALELSYIGCNLSDKYNIQYYISDKNKTSNKVGNIICIKNLKTGEVKKYKSRNNAAKLLNINPSTLGSRCKCNSVINDFEYYFEKNKNAYSNILKQKLFEYGLIGKICDTKFIPDDYKYNSKEVRIEVLRGLMDSDGTVKDNGEASFATTSLRLAEDVIEIVRSLGGRAKLRSRNRIGKKIGLNSRIIKAKKISYEFTVSLPEELNPFFIKRKASKYSQKYIYDDKIDSVEYVGKKEVQCISIDHPEHLYLTNDFIVTHNTKEEKMASWVQPFFDNIKVIFGKNTRYIDNWVEDGTIEVESLSYIRGRSLPRTIFILDEAQNITYHEAKAVLTRMGEGSKIILLGDLAQIDAPHLDSTNNGLASVVELFKDFYLSGHITLLKGERSPLASHAAKIL